MWIVPWDPFLMKKLLKNEICGSVNSTQCIVRHGKVNLCGYCSWNSTWTVTAFPETSTPKRKKKEEEEEEEENAKRANTETQRVSKHHLSLSLMPLFYLLLQSAISISIKNFVKFFLSIKFLKKRKNFT